MHEVEYQFISLGSYGQNLVVTESFDNGLKAMQCGHGVKGLYHMPHGVIVSKSCGHRCI